MTGNPYIEALAGTSMPEAGRDSHITYMFDFWGGRNWTAGEIAAFEAAQQTWAAVANITFERVTSYEAADMVETLMSRSMMAYWFGPGASAAHFSPDPVYTADGYFTSNGAADSDAFNLDRFSEREGSYNFETFVHEIGHGLGLAHPHDDGQGTGVFPGVSYEYDTGSHGLNQNIYTVMTYNSYDWVSPSFGNAAGPMAFDIAAIQSMYGANMSHRTGNDLYTLSSVSGNVFGLDSYWTCIWDAGGTDEIAVGDASQYMTGASIDLRAATLQNAPGGGGYLNFITIAAVFDSGPVHGGFTIANGVVIENATGGAGGDSLTGNDVANVLSGLGGNDTITAGLGNDALYGGDGNDILSGGAGDDALFGGAGDDDISGGAGADAMSGGDGSDSYSVDDLRDTVTETARPGLDSVMSTVSFTLGDHVENLVLTGDGADRGVGNGLANSIAGNASANILAGRGGDDTIDGGAGNDILAGGEGNDSLYGGTGTDYAVFAGTLRGYAFELEAGAWTVLDLDLLSFGDDGLDRLTGVEVVVFRGGGNSYLTLAGLIQSLADRDGAANSVSEYAVAGAAVGITAHAADGSRDAVTYSLVDSRGGVYAIDAATGVVTLANASGLDYESGDNRHRIVVRASSADGSFTEQAFDIAVTNADEPASLSVNGVRASISENSATPEPVLVASIRVSDDGGLPNVLSLSGEDAEQFVIIGDGLFLAAGTVLDYEQQASYSVAVQLDNAAFPGSPDVSSSVFTLSIGDVLGEIVSGTAGDDVMRSGAGLDQLTGLAGNDTLDGGADGDTLTGGLGNDVYFVDSIADRVVELASQGTDTVRSSAATLVLAANVETLVLIGSGDIAGTGNALDNNIVGNAGANRLDGGAGNDTLEGGDGNDLLSGGLGIDGASYRNAAAGVTVSLLLTAAQATGGAGTDTLAGIENLIGSAHADALIGNAGNNVLSGFAGDDALDGGAGADSLDGGAGADTLTGGLGNDLYLVDDAGDSVIETALSGSGIDKVASTVTFDLSKSGANVEQLELLGHAGIGGTGNGLANTITGNASANTLSGLAGNDTLNGGAGDDRLLGGTGNDILSGGDGNDRLDGEDGVDRMSGGKGDDTYVVSAPGDVVSELAGEGTADAVESFVTYTLGANLENLTLVGGSAINATGNAVANALVGNGAANVIKGLAGGDTLSGGGGDDVLYGGAGDDALWGDAGADAFVFDAAFGTAAAPNVDRIYGFETGVDEIRLENAIFTRVGLNGALAESAFTIGSVAADASDRIVYDSATGWLSYDADGSGAGVKVVFARLEAGTELTAGDIVVI